MHSLLLRFPLASGWFRIDDLGITKEQMTSFLRSRGSPLEEAFLLRHRLVRGDGEDFKVAQLDPRAVDWLRLLREWRCLDLVNGEALIQNLSLLQVISQEALGVRPPLQNWRDVRGLFYTPGWPVLQDTYCDLAALEILGGLDRIDREACIRAILRLHRGKGFFAPPATDEPWRLKIQGDARDTFCAFESLRILGALDRVSDLSEWKFRTKKRSKANDSSSQISWEDIEAWVCQQRLERFLRVTGGSSGKTGPSLLDP